MKKKVYVELLDNNDSIIKKIQLNEIPIKEEYILTTSKEEYDNDEPCVIIRTCIRNDIYRKFTKYLKRIDNKIDEIISIGKLPSELQDSMDFGDNVVNIRCR